VTHVTPRFAILVCLAGAWSACTASRADTIQTAGVRLEGETTVRERAILIGGSAVPLNGIIAVIRDTGANTFGALQAIRLRNGEIWRARILGLESNRLTVISDLFGRCTIGTESVAALDFSSSPDPGVLHRTGALYRTHGEPIPGTLLWIGEDMLAVDCPLGALTVPRVGTLYYLFEHDASPSAAGPDDEIGLIDGSIIHGRLSLGANGLEMTHAALGALSVPWAAVRYVRRSPPGLMRLGVPPAGDIAIRDPAGRPTAARLIDYRYDGERRPPMPSCLTAVRMQAGTVAQYRLPARKGQDSMFHAVAAPVTGCRGDVRIGLRVSGEIVYERLLAPTNAPVAVSIPLPPGDTLTIDVDFGGRILHPCGVDWRDPCVVFRSE